MTMNTVRFSKKAVLDLLAASLENAKLATEHPGRVEGISKVIDVLDSEKITKKSFRELLASKACYLIERWDFDPKNGSAQVRYSTPERQSAYWRMATYRNLIQMWYN